MSEDLLDQTWDFFLEELDVTPRQSEDERPPWSPRLALFKETVSDTSFFIWLLNLKRPIIRGGVVFAGRWQTNSGKKGLGGHTPPRNSSSMIPSAQA